MRGIVTVEYNGELALSVRVLFIKIKILPKKDNRKKVRSMSRKKSERIERQLKKKADKKQLKKAAKKEKKESEKKEKEKKKVSLSGILDTVSLITSIVRAALGSFFGHLRVDVAKFKITVATGDAASTAVAYGAVSQAVSYLLALFKDNKRVKGLKTAEMDVVCDFLGESPSADIKISFSIRVWHIFHLAFASLKALIKHKFNSLKNEN